MTGLRRLLLPLLAAALSLACGSETTHDVLTNGEARQLLFGWNEVLGRQIVRIERRICTFSCGTFGDCAHSCASEPLPWGDAVVTLNSEATLLDSIPAETQLELEVCASSEELRVVVEVGGFADQWSSEVPPPACP